MILEVIKKMNGENIAVRAYKLIIDLYKKLWNSYQHVNWLFEFKETHLSFICINKRRVESVFMSVKFETNLMSIHNICFEPQQGNS